MTPSTQLAWLVAVCSIALSCQPGVDHDSAGSIQPGKMMTVTEQIVYSGFIKNPYDSGDWWLENIESSKRNEFLKLLIDAVNEGKLTAYSGPLGLPTNSSEHALSQDQFADIFNARDTVFTEDIETGKLVADVVETHLSIDKIIRMEFIEAWSFDEENLKMEKKVAGIGPQIEVWDQNGELRGYKTLFYIWFEDIELKDIML